MLIHFYKLLNHFRATPARKDKIILIFNLVSLLVNLLIWYLIYYKLRPLVAFLPQDQSFIPLHYNVFLGIDSFGHWQNIFWLPALGLFFWLFNVIASFILYNSKKLASYFLTIGSFACQIIFLVSCALIILINI